MPAYNGRQHAQPGTWAPPYRADAKEETLVGYIARRIGTAVIVVIGISIFTFGMLHLIFPSPAIVVLGATRQLPADRGVQ